MKKLLVISLFINCYAEAELKRIQSFRFDRSKSQPIHLTPGLGSIVLFPCSIVEVFVGRSEDLKVQISPNDRKSLFLNLKKTSSKPTNIICRCEDNRTVFVFDIVPSHGRHQDVVELRSAFGRPEHTIISKEASITGTTSPKVVVLKKPIVIEEGTAK